MFSPLVSLIRSPSTLSTVPTWTPSAPITSICSLMSLNPLIAFLLRWVLPKRIIPVSDASGPGVQVAFGNVPAPLLFGRSRHVVDSPQRDGADQVERLAVLHLAVKAERN